MAWDPRLLLLLTLLPFALLAAVTVGVWACARLARWLERVEEKDPHQERAFAVAGAPPALSRASGMVVEGVWQTVAFTLQGLHWVVPFRTPTPCPGGGPPVLLVAGYLENAGQMWLLARRLRARGLQPVLVDLPSTLAPIADNAAFVAGRLREVIEASGYRRVGYVGHSMGGVIGRACALLGDDPPLATVITIASPHRGTHLARLGAGGSARDMRPGSAYLSGCAPGRCGAVPVHTVIAPSDNIVSPAWSTILGEGDDLVLTRPVGHVAPLFLAEVTEQVVAWLEAADYGPEPASSATAAGLAQAS